MDLIASLLPHLDTIGGSALVTIFFVAMLKGWIVPSKQVERLITSYRSQTEDWRAAHASSEDARRIQANQIEDLTSELARTTNAIMKALAIRERRMES